MQRVHLSETQVRKLKRKRYKQTPNAKPDGFWFSYAQGSMPEDRTWQDFCVGDRWNVDGCRWRQDVHISESANVLLIDSLSAFDAFAHRYMMGTDYGRIGIDWLRVAAQYDGIEIRPYLWARRLCAQADWYYTWDCSSGCVWNLDVLTLDAPVRNLTDLQIRQYSWPDDYEPFEPGQDD